MALVMTVRKDWGCICRSPEHQKLDESGISSEEGCIPQQVYTQLTDIASLVRDLETTLEVEAGVGSSKTPPEGGGEGRGKESDFCPASDTCITPESRPHGTRNTRRAHEWHDRPLVYSRTSSQVVPSGHTPNLEVVVLKDTHMSRRAEVTVKPPSEEASAGDRRRTRAALSRTQFGTVNYTESFSSSESTSSDDDSGDTGGSRAVGERKKKRVFHRKVQQKQKKKAARVSHVKTGGKVKAAGFVLAVEEEGRSRGRESEGEMEEGEWGPGVVQMECEIGGEEQGPPLPSLSYSPHTFRVGATRVHAAVYEGLGQPFLLGAGSRRNLSQKMDALNSRQSRPLIMRGGINPETVVKPCSVVVTGLPRHIVNQYLSATSAAERSSTAGDTLVSHNDLCGEETSDEDSSSSSESVSMLAAPSHQMSVGCGLQSQSQDGEDSSLSRNLLTPHRVGSRGKSPRARRSFPFSKPLPTLQSQSSSTSTGNIASPVSLFLSHKQSPSSSESPSHSKRRLSLSSSKHHLTPSHSPSPSKDRVPSSKSSSPARSLLPSNFLSPSSSKSPSPGKMSESKSPSPPLAFNFLSPTSSRTPSPPPTSSPTAPPPPPPPHPPPKSPKSSNTTTPTRTTKSSGSSSGGGGGTQKFPVLPKPTPPKPRKTRLSLSSRKGSGSVTPTQRLAVEWSSDDDFRADPSPSVVVSPAPKNQQTKSLPPPVTTEGNSLRGSSTKSTPVLGTMPPSPGSTGQILRSSSSPNEPPTTGARDDHEEEEEGVLMKKLSPQKRSPAKAAAHRPTENNSANSGESLSHFIPKTYHFI